MSLIATPFASLRLNYLFVDRYEFSSSWVYPENHIPYSMLRLVTKGEAVFSVDGEGFPARENEIIYIPQGCTLSCRALSDELTFISIRFTAAVPAVTEEIWSESFGIQRKTECPDGTIQGYFGAMVEARKSALPGKLFRLKGYLELIMAYLIDMSAEERRRSGFEPRRASLLPQGADGTGRERFRPDTRIQTVIEYLTAHPYEELDLDKMCGMTELSQSSLRRLFREHTGKSPTDFLMEMRMVTAARLLMETEDRISQIAYSLGFSDPNYFARRFRKNYGTTPQRYRKVSRS